VVPFRNGQAGTVVLHSHSAASVQVEPFSGAAGTFKSLRLLGGGENIQTGSRAAKRDRFNFQGVQHDLQGGGGGRPSKVSYYVQVGEFGKRIGYDTHEVPRSHSSAMKSGALFGIHEMPATREVGSEIGATSGHNKAQTAPDRAFSSMVGVGITHGRWCHGANFFHLPDVPFYNVVEENKWYKVDIFLTSSMACIPILSH
jgi:hypothetical protein